MSAIDLPNATFHINYINHWNYRIEKSEIYDILLVANKTKVLTGIPVNFTQYHRMFINTGPMNEYGFQRREITVHGLKYTEMIATERVDLPFTGLRYERVCDRNWHGLKCDNFCNNINGDYFCNKFCNNDYATIVGRRCTQDGHVGCPLGFHGSNCDQPIDQDAPECQCQYKGICVSRFESPLDSKDSLFCECTINRWGRNCENKDYGRLTSFLYDKNDSMILNWDHDTTSVENEFY